MRKKRIMIIGPRDCGKTSLANCINNYSGQLRKTQDTIFSKYTIDVPSAYIENSWMYMHTIALSQDARAILLLVDQSRPTMVYSPGFSRVFKCPVVGIISKCDLNSNNYETCVQQLNYIGVKTPIYSISTKTGEGLDKLKSFLIEAGYIGD